MKFSSSATPWLRRAVAVQFLAATALCMAAHQANAAEHYVGSSTSTVDCRNFGGGVKAGDSIVLAAGNRGPLTIRNCTGQSGNPIIVRNDPKGNGPTVVRRTSASTGGFVFTCRDCVDVVIDGTAKWNGAPQGAYCGAPAGTNGCGIKVTSIVENDSPTTYLKMLGMTTRIIVRGVEIDGQWPRLNTTGVGIDLNDHSIKAADFPSFWREDVIYERNYVHNVFGEGLYIGPNWRPPDVDVPLRNITIRDNLVEDTGRPSIQLKSAIGGTNRIHHNVARRSGLRAEGHQGTGITVVDSGRSLIYSNWVEAAGVQGIQVYQLRLPSSYGPYKTDIYNNVVYDSGKLEGSSTNGHGITVARSSDTATITPTIYNNTVVRTVRAGINFGSRITGGVVRDNIVSEWGTSALSVNDKNTVSNNRTGSISSIRFMDSGRLNFALADDSPARDSGSTSGYPVDDHLRTARPQGGRADQGAFEYSSAAAAPKPPAPMSVQ